MNENAVKAIFIITLGVVTVSYLQLVKKCIRN